MQHRWAQWVLALCAAMLWVSVASAEELRVSVSSVALSIGAQAKVRVSGASGSVRAVSSAPAIATAALSGATLVITGKRLRQGRGARERPGAHGHRRSHRIGEFEHAASDLDRFERTVARAGEQRSRDALRRSRLPGVLDPAAVQRRACAGAAARHRDDQAEAADGRGSGRGLSVDLEHDRSGRRRLPQHRQRGDDRAEVELLAAGAIARRQRPERSAGSRIARSTPVRCSICSTPSRRTPACRFRIRPSSPPSPPRSRRCRARATCRRSSTATTRTCRSSRASRSARR